MKIKSIAIIALSGLLSFACSQDRGASIKSGNLTLTFNDSLYTNIDYSSTDQPLTAGFQPSEVLRIENRELDTFLLQDYQSESFTDQRGSGHRLIVEGVADIDGFDIEKRVIATAYDHVPDLISTQVIYYNHGDEEIPIEGWDNNRYTVQPLADNDHSEEFWSFQGGSYSSRPDWVLPVGQGFQQQNFLGMNASDYGGGTPVVDIWRPDAGLAVGHLDTEPQLVSLPVRAMGQTLGAQIKVQFDADSVSQAKYPHSILPRESLSTFETFLTAHTGDYYTSLKKYRDMMTMKGITFSTANDAAYEPIWCAWGYGRDFSLDQVILTLPKVKELGFDWAVLDDGWQIAEGDWQTNSKFDEMSMKEFVDQIHDSGLKAKLWWAPLAADPGSRVHEEETDMLLVNKQGEYQRISWWNSDYLNPALPSVKEYHTQLVEKFMVEWGYDGLKIDGQHLNQVPPDHGHDHIQVYPEESVEELPDLYKEIYETAMSINPNAVVEICPCGASGSSFIMPYMNQSVSSDPLSSWQIRHKGKTYKALMGEDAAYYGDHVELSDNRNDFASTVGIGGVIGTKFTLPDPSSPNRNELTAEKEELIKKWMNIYRTYMLPKGQYRGELYDIGFDYPETHVVQKDGSLFYTFYSETFNGQVELRGLDSNVEYQLFNYETGETLGSTEGPTALFSADFSDHLMIEARASE